MQIEIITSILAFSSGICAAVLTFALQKKVTKSTLEIDESSIAVSVSPSNELAMTMFNNNGEALFVSMDLECKGGPVTLQRLTVRLKNNKKTPLLIGTLYPENRPIKFSKGDFKTVKFIFNACHISNNIQELIATFHSSATSFSLYADQKKCVGRTKMKKRIKHINILDTKKQYILKTPPFQNKEEGEKFVNLLKSNGILEAFLKEYKTDSESNNLINLAFLGNRNTMSSQ